MLKDALIFDATNAGPCGQGPQSRLFPLLDIEGLDLLTAFQILHRCVIYGANMSGVGCKEISVLTAVTL